jgi:acetyl esterase/lipase
MTKWPIDPDLAGMVRVLPSWDWTATRAWLFQFVMANLPTPSPRHARREVADLGGRQLRIFHPVGREPRGALLWLHGGGRIMGHPKQDELNAVRFVRELGVVVVPQYRLAPADPFPAGLDDCVAAWRWLVDNAARLGVDPSRLLVGGESAGGGLAAELTQRVYDEGGRQPLAQVLVYPMLDDRTALDEATTAAGYRVWSNRSNRYAWGAYLGDAFGREAAPAYAAAARRDDLSGLPPAWFMTCEHDLFRDEGLTYVQRLRDAGVSVDVHDVPGAVHGVFAIGRSQPPILRIWDSLRAFAEARL